MGVLEYLAIDVDIVGRTGSRLTAGGFFGHIYSLDLGSVNMKVRKSYFDGSFTSIGADSSWGGFVGDIRDGYSGTYNVPINLAIEEVAIRGQVSANSLDMKASSGENVAGMIGYIRGVQSGISITDSYSIMSINSSKYVCGIICGKYDAATPVTVNRYFGVINNTATTFFDNGGFTSSLNGTWSTVGYSFSNSFWDETTSGAISSGEGTVGGRPTATLKSNAFWNTEGYFSDVPAIWSQTEGEYPRLNDSFFD